MNWRVLFSLFIGIVFLLSAGIASGKSEWEERHFGDHIASEAAEWLSGFEEQCPQSQCDRLTPNADNLDDLQEAVNYQAEWEWLTGEIKSREPLIAHNQKRLFNLYYNLKFGGSDRPGTVDDQAQRAYDNYLNLVEYTDRYQTLSQEYKFHCGFQVKGVRTDHTPACKEKKAEMDLAALGISQVYEESPLLAMGPMQSKLMQDVEASKGKSQAEFISQSSFERRLSQAAHKAYTIAVKKGREYRQILREDDKEKRRKILHSPNLLAELDPGRMSFSGVDADQIKKERPVTCRLAARIHREGAAKFLKESAKTVGLIVLPGGAVGLVGRLILGSSRLKSAIVGSGKLKATLVATGVTAEAAGVGLGWQDLKSDERKCQQLRDRYYTTSDIMIQSGRQASAASYEAVQNCEAELSAKKQMLIVGGLLGGAGGVMTGIGSYTKLTAPAPLYKSTWKQRLRQTSERLRSSAKEARLAFKFGMSPKTKTFKKDHATFDGIGEADNARFIDAMKKPGGFKKKVTMEFEMSFLKPLNDVTLRDKTFATALGNFGKKRFAENLKKQLGSKYDKALKYKDYKSVRVALDDSPEVRAALQRAYSDTITDVEKLFADQFPEASELLRIRGNPASGNVSKQFNGGMGSGVRGPDKAMKMARHARSMDPKDAKKLHHYDNHVDTFDAQARNIETARRKVQKILLKAPNGRRALAKVRDGVYVLSSDAVQIIRKSSLKRRMRNSPEAEAAADNEYFGKIRMGLYQQTGVKLDYDEVRALVRSHQALDEFSPSFFSVKPTSMNVDEMSPDIARKTFMTFDREKAGATNEEAIARRLAGQRNVSAESTIIQARQGVDDADEILAGWRSDLQNLAFHSLSREGKIRLAGGSEEFAKLGKVEQGRYLRGEQLDQYMRISADDAFLTGRGVLTEEDLATIGRAIAQSEIGDVTRTTIGTVSPSRYHRVLSRLTHGRLGQSPGQLAQSAGEFREAVSKRFVESIYRKGRPGKTKKPYFEVRANRERPWERVDIIVYGRHSRTDRTLFERAFKESVEEMGRAGRVRFVEAKP